MAKVLAGMTMSLDGFINDSTGSAQALSPDFDELLNSSSFKQMAEDTGAVIMGNNTYNMADPFLWVNDEYEFQVPLFILTHRIPENIPPGNGRISVTFVTDGIESAIEQARFAAGHKMVQVIGGADTIQQTLNSGMCDELQIDVMPVLLGDGLRLFENIKTDTLKLERKSVEQVTPQRTSIVYTVKTSAG
jgi:dihydrofolate reductase